jgi:glycosyltransferase involved in cell wall biosynthesis
MRPNFVPAPGARLATETHVKVLFLCKRYYTNKDLLLDRFGRLFHIPVQLSRQGATVSVLALDYRSDRQISAEIDGVKFETVPATLRRFPFVIGKLKREVGRIAPDVIVASGDSHIGFIGRRLAATLGAKFVFDVYDYYPAFKGNRVPGMRAMFESAVRDADLTFCASRPLMDLLAGQCGRTILIENGVDRELFFPRDKQVVRNQLGLSTDAMLVGYFGSITPTRGPLLFEAVERLRSDLPGLGILLSGKVSEVDLNRPGVMYRGELPQSEIPAMISACDVVTVPYARDPFNNMAGPCKVAEYLACEKPVVATRVAGHSEVFKVAPSSLCEPQSADVARALLQQFRDPKLEPFPECLDWAQIGLNGYSAIASL